MLLELTIKQFGIIEKEKIEFKKGLSVLSGETGAGKSMVLLAISQLFGDRTSTDFIRYGEDKASVEGVFDLPENEKLKTLLEESGIDVEDDVIILRRDIYKTGKSICRINGSVTTLATLKKVSQFLLDIHAQHDSTQLLVEKNHLNLLDSFASNEITKLKNNYKEKYEEYKKIVEKIKKLKERESETLQKQDFLIYQLTELTRAKLKQGEIESLEEEISVLENYEKIASLTANLTEDLNGESGVVSKLYKIKQNIERLENYNVDFSETLEEVTNTYYTLQDFGYEVASYLDDIEYDENKLNNLELRHTNLKTLEKKYSKSIEELIQFKEELEEEIFLLENFDDNVKKLEKEEEKLFLECTNLASSLTNKRKQVANELEKLIYEELKFLLMEKSTIKINIEKKELSSSGGDDVKILISANTGEPLKSLSKVASGGELSRIMLALKIIFAKNIETVSIIFDEIDTGVSGRVSQKMAEKMYQLATTSQVLCISHLPQVTALADCNLLINKKVIEERTLTTIKELNDEEKTYEIARMISGEKPTQLSLEHAREMLKIATQTKEKIKKLK